MPSVCRHRPAPASLGDRATRRDDAGTTLSVDLVDISDLLAFKHALRSANEHPDVVLESTYGRYWLADYLGELGATRRISSTCCASDAYVAPPELWEVVA